MANGVFQPCPNQAWLFKTNECVSDMDFMAHQHKKAISRRKRCKRIRPSKLMTSLMNVSLKFQMLISEIHQYFC